MTVSTTSAAVHITPGASSLCSLNTLADSPPRTVVIKTFVKHARTKGRKFREGDRTVIATDDIFFDEYVPGDGVPIRAV